MKVKQIEWYSIAESDEEGPRTYVYKAETPFGDYHVRPLRSGYMWTSDHSAACGIENNMLEVDAAVQADFERTVMACLEPKGET